MAINQLNSTLPLTGPSRDLSHSDTYPNPWLDYASLLRPDTIEEAYDIAEMMFYTNRTFAQAIEYMVAYFTGTDVNLVAKDEDSTSEYRDFLKQVLDIQSVLFLVGRDTKIYGNSCISVLAPFKRFLISEHTGNVYPIEEIDWKFSIKKGFQFSCPETGKQTTCKAPIDRPTQEGGGIVIKRWPLKQVKAAKSSFSNKVTYYYDLSAEEKKLIRDGDSVTLYDIPWGMVEACREDKQFEFAPGMIYHISCSNLSDIDFGPWGVPPCIASFKDAYLTQILKRNNEVIALDHMLPIKMVSPAGNSTGSGVDFMRNTNLGTFGSLVMRSLDRAKRDPSGWMYFPVPVNYQVLNGDGKNFVTPELLEQSQAEFLNGVGIPVEMYRKNLSAQSAPFAARLFEAGEVVFFGQLNSCLKWIVDRVSAILHWDTTNASLVKPTHADDLDRRMIMLQMMMGGIASEQDVLSLFGLDWKDTFKKRMDEQEFKMKEEKERIDRMQKLQENEMILNMPPEMMAGGMGGMPPGAAPPGAGAPAAGPPSPMGPVNGMVGGAPGGQTGGTDVETFLGDAQAKAQEIATSYPLGSPERRQVLSQLKQTQPELHAQVVALLEQMTDQAEAEGRNMLRQPMPPMGGAPMM